MREYTVTNVFLGSMLSFSQSKTHQSSQILHTGPSYMRHWAPAAGDFEQLTSELFLLLSWPLRFKNLSSDSQSKRLKSEVEIHLQTRVSFSTSQTPSPSVGGIKSHPTCNILNSGGARRAPAVIYSSASSNSCAEAAHLCTAPHQDRRAPDSVLVPRQFFNWMSVKQEGNWPLINGCLNCPRDEFVWASFA